MAELLVGCKLAPGKLKSYLFAGAKNNMSRSMMQAISSIFN